MYIIIYIYKYVIKSDCLGLNPLSNLWYIVKGAVSNKWMEGGRGVDGWIDY